MPRFKILALSLLLTGLTFSAAPKKKTRTVVDPQNAIRTEIAAVHERSGGIYYAYPSVADSLPPVPDGYVPVAISHYGRHGSRWVIKPKIYDESLEALRKAQESGNLLPEGESAMKSIETAYGHAKGHFGELSPVGQRQHRAIARRMASRFPSLFEGNAKVTARSSEVPRCIISMASFLNELTRMNPQTDVAMQSSPGEMEIIALDIPAEKKHLMVDHSADPKRVRFYMGARDSLTRSLTTASRLFKDPAKVKNLPSVMRDIYDVAIDVQDVVGLEIDLFHLFDQEDLYNQWKSNNYNHYMDHSNLAETWSAGPYSAIPLVTDIVERADLSLSGQAAPVDLRFGHDTVLMRLLALIGAENAGGNLGDNLEKVTAQYQNFKLSPMGANLQFAFFRNADGNTIVSVRLNEQPLKINGLSEVFPGYYSWSDLRSHLMKAAQSAPSLN